MKRGELVQAIEALHTAIQNVVENWEKGNLAASIQELAAVDREYAVPALEWWESDE